MKLETLKHIKSQLASLYKLVDAIAKARPNLSGYMIVAVFIQNAWLNVLLMKIKKNQQFNSLDCANFNLEEEVNQIHTIREILYRFAEYDNDSFYDFVYKEYTAIVEGNENEIDYSQV